MSSLAIYKLKHDHDIIQSQDYHQIWIPKPATKKTFMDPIHKNVISEKK